MTITVSILGAEHVRLPDGREFKGLNCETDAARALIADGWSPQHRVLFQWSSGRASTYGAIGSFARWRYTTDGRQTWQPHPMAETPPHLVNWAAQIAAEAKARARAAA